MPESRGLVLGCGGALGFAWTAVALDALSRELDWDLRTADVIVGTSAGAEMAALLGSGRSAADILAAVRGGSADPVLARHLSVNAGAVPSLPRLGWPAAGLLRGRDLDLMGRLAGLLPRGRGDASWLRALGDGLQNADEWVDHPATWLVGADTRDGRRVAFGAQGSPTASLGDAIAASWAIPGWFPPVQIGGRSYLDGGTVSPTSADLVASLGLDEVYIVAPMSTRGGAAARGLARAERVLRTVMTRRVDHEQELLERAGTRVVRIEPGADELEAMGANFMDVRRRDQTIRAASDRWSSGRAGAASRPRPAGRNYR